MISRGDLNNLMSQEGIRCYEVVIEPNSFEKSVIILDSDDINELIEFMKSNEISNVFFTYSFYNEKMFFIDEETASKLNEEALSLVQEEIKDHNDFIEKINFSIPFEIDIFCLYQGHFVSISQYDSWRNDQGLMTGKEKLLEIINAKSQLIEHQAEERKKKDEALKEEFKNYVFNDEEFRMCTNQRLRRDYMYLVFNRKETESYKHLFWIDDRLDISTALNFIEMLWREYKT